MAPHLSFQRDGAAIRPVPLSDGASPLPCLETGTRYDGGDAETGGFGLDLDLGATHCPGGVGGTGHQFAAQLAYGFPTCNDRLMLTPDVALALSRDSRIYSLLWSVAPYSQQERTEPWKTALEGERQEHSLKLRFSLLF